VRDTIPGIEDIQVRSKLENNLKDEGVKRNIGTTKLKDSGGDNS